MKLDSAILPESIEVDGVFYPVHSDFKFWLKFYSITQDGENHLVTDFDFLYKDEKPLDRVKGFEKLKAFFSPVNPLPRSDDSTASIKYYDFIIDSDLIFAAFYERYKIDLMDEKTKLHWHKFLALFNGLHDTKFNDIVGYRAFKKGDKTKYDDQMERLRRMWEITDDTGLELTDEEKDFLENFNKL